MCDQQSLRSACAYAQSDQNLCKSLEYCISVKLLTESHSEFLSLKGGCRGSSESTLDNMSNCWKSHAAAHIYFSFKDDETRFMSFLTSKLFQNFVLHEYCWYTFKTTFKFNPKSVLCHRHPA